MTEAIKYDITIQQGADYEIDFLTQEDDGTAISVSGFSPEAQLREFPEDSDRHEFTCTADGTGFHLTMDHAETAKISYPQGYYDLFITRNGKREKFAEGGAVIVPNATR